ncbi:hypothetical protein [Thalassotalea ganghwensis]
MLLNRLSKVTISLFTTFLCSWLLLVVLAPMSLSALLGGVIAKTVVTRLSARRLKLFFSFWLIVIGAVGLKP